MDRLTQIVKGVKKPPFMHSHGDCMMHFLATIATCIHVHTLTNGVLADMSV